MTLKAFDEFDVNNDGKGKAREILALELASGGHGLGVSHPDAFAQERNAGTSNQYGVGVGECNATVIDGTAAIAVSGGAPALVFSILIITSGNTATIVGLLDDDDVAKTVVLTSSSASQLFDLKGMKVGTSFTVTDALGDDVVVFWRPQ